ncbi:MAG: hypothetical protein QM489_00930 [Candidatus Izemoplasma sp.]
MQPTTSAGMDGIGAGSNGMVEGTNVVGFARDGRAMNDLIIIGVLGGMAAEAPYTGDKLPKSEQEVGFQDPREESDINDSPRKYNKINDRDPGYPGKKIPQGRYPQEKFLEESDVNRLARGEKLDDTLLEEKKTGKLRFSPTGGDADDIKRKKQIAIPSVTGTWDEKDSMYGAKYPYNRVNESESGHVTEVDDTPGAERLHKWHRYGTYEEIGPKGERMVKIIGEDFCIVMNDKKLYVDGNFDITTKGFTNLFSISGINITSEGPVTVIAPAITVTSPLVNFVGILQANGKPVLTAG